MGGPSNPLVNAAGSTLDHDSVAKVYGTNYNGTVEPGAPGSKSQLNLSLGQQASFFLNWLTAGVAPKPVDPGQVFTDQQASAPAAQAAAKGQGIGGLFGTGSMIGELAPPIKPLQGIKPLNLSPLQPGVPYSVPAVPKVGGR